MSNIKDTKYLDLLDDERRKTYMKMLNYSNIGNDELRNKINELIYNFSTPIRQTQVLKKLKYKYGVYKASFLVTCFKAIRHGGNTIYSFLYTIYNEKTGKIEPVYICNSSTYSSQDGEYRNRFLPYDQFIFIYENKLKEYFDELETKVLSDIASQKLTLFADQFYPENTKDKISKLNKQFIDENRLLIISYMMGWFVDYYELNHNLIPNHIHPGYLIVFGDDTYQTIYEHIFDKITQPITTLNKLTRYYIDPSHSDLFQYERLGVGQKIIPMTYYETMTQFNIYYKAWRELQFTIDCSNLMYNFISPSFAAVGRWYYIQNSSDALYDNKSMANIYSHGKVGDEITKQLEQADKLNYSDRQSGIFVDGRFKYISKKISSSIQHANRQIRITNISLCFLSEYVGRTIKDVPKLLNEPVIAKEIFIALTDKHVFTKHIFEFIYGFYAMNKHLKMLHGDFHSNNGTISKVFSTFRHDNQAQLIDNPHVIYHFADKQTYLFPHYGTFSFIIDLSRAILRGRTKMKDKYGKVFTKKFFSDQQIRVVKMLHKYFPVFTQKYEKKIFSALTDNYKAMFKVMTAIDTYSMTIGILQMTDCDVQFNGLSKYQLPDGIPQLLKNIQLFAEEYIIKNLTLCINRKNPHHKQMKYPNAVIISKFFKNYLFDKQHLQDKTIIDVFNMQNPIKYNDENYDSLSPLMNFNIEAKVAKKTGIDINDIHDFSNFEDIQEREPFNEGEVNMVINRFDKFDNPVIDDSSDWMYE